jgi:hypothetical protein
MNSLIDKISHLYINSKIVLKLLIVEHTCMYLIIVKTLQKRGVMFIS